MSASNNTITVLSMGGSAETLRLRSRQCRENSRRMLNFIGSHAWGCRLPSGMSHVATLIGGGMKGEEHRARGFEKRGT